jgi:deazaflavin-dependent oxidoreductase (nitroreductase family)
VTTDLHDVGKRKTVKLTTRGRKSGTPRDVTIWFAVAGRRTIHVQHASVPAAQWYKNLLADPRVEVDFGDGPRAARARPLEDPDQVRQVLRRIRRKYWMAWAIQLMGRGAAAVAAEITLTEEES